MRECGCEDRGRHRRTCLKHIEKGTLSIDKKSKKSTEGSSLYELCSDSYGTPPHLYWYPNTAKQKTVEHRIERYVRRYKSFYLTTSSLSAESDEKETWYVDGGNWASKKDSNGYNILVGHIVNCLEFLGGRRPQWKRRIRS